MTGRSLMVALASIAILVLVGLRLVPAADYGTGIATHGSRDVTWMQPAALPEDAADAVPESGERAFRVASVVLAGGEATVPSRASTRPSSPPIKRARSQLGAAAGVATSADPY